MAIEITRATLETYIKQNPSSEINSGDILNSVFSYDKYNEQGNAGKDNKLTGDEFRDFMQNAAGKIKSFIDGFLRATNPEYKKQAEEMEAKMQGQMQANQANNIPQVVEIPPTKTPQELEQFKGMVEEAKNLLKNNADALGLTPEELKYIDTVTTESIRDGAGRFDKQDNVVKINVNDGGYPTNVGSLVKLIMHEVTHATMNKDNSQTQELACERRGVEVALTLSNINPDIGDFPIGTQEDFSMLSELQDENKRNDVLNNWVTQYYSHLPKE